MVTNLRNRVTKLEKALQAKEGDALVIIAPVDLANDDDLAITINGKLCFTGAKGECDRWINENIGTVKTIIVGEGELEE